MKVLVDLCIVPVGAGVSLSRYIAECECILAEAGLTHQLHANGTNIEGEWDEVFAAIKRCHTKLHEMGVPRVSTYLHMGTRTDRDQSMADKVQSVLARMEEACADEDIQSLEVQGLS
jgi:uncharacterized protein (TIGR00106 family)